MSLFLRRATYLCRPISSVPALAATLRMTEQELAELAEAANGLYRPVKMKLGSTRQVFDAQPRLKRVHTRIKNEILCKVVFPDYLTGSLKRRDYKANASLHAGKSVLITEDVKGFFGAVKGAVVYDIWRNFFGFHPDVAHLLAKLTTKDDALPQGGIPSSYLANLALWGSEPLLQAKLQAKGITYSRYVDDMGMSSVKRLDKDEKKAVIAMVYGMLRKHGLSANRIKHEIMPATDRMISTQLVTNRKPALRAEQRSATRAAVFQAERFAASCADHETARAHLDKAAGRVGQLGRFHPNEAAPLRKRLAAARQALLPRQQISSVASALATSSGTGETSAF